MVVKLRARQCQATAVGIVKESGHMVRLKEQTNVDEPRGHHIE